MSWGFPGRARRQATGTRRRVVLRPDGDLVELGLDPRADLLGRAHLPGVADVLVAGYRGVVVQDPDRDRIGRRSDLPRAVEVHRIVLDLVAVGARELRRDRQAVPVREQQRLARVVQPRVEHLRQPLGAALDDAHEREAAVEVGGADDVVEELGDPVDRLRDERRVGDAERDGQRVQRVEVAAAGRRVALQADRRGRRGLLLGEAVDLVVVQDRRQVHVVADRVDPVRRADAAAVAVAGVDEHREVGPRHLHALGDRERAAVDAVEAVRLHVVREARRAADARHEHRALRRQVLVAAQPLHRGEDRVVAAAAAPARHAALVVLELVVGFVQLDQALGDGHRHK